MPSDTSRPARLDTSPSRTIAALLDLFSGFAVWAVHFLIVYCANALACARGIGEASEELQHAFRAALVAVTLASAALVAAHAGRAWRWRGESGAFRTELTVGNDALATTGILLQLFPLAMLHLCR